MKKRKYILVSGIFLAAILGTTLIYAQTTPPLQSYSDRLGSLSEKVGNTLAELEEIQQEINSLKSEIDSILNSTGEPPTFNLYKADFHIHTTHSQGKIPGGLTPTEVVQFYAECGYDIIAITDHDTIAGVEEAQEAGLIYNLTVIAGEEISCTWDDYTFKHIIALYITENIERTYWHSDIVQPYFDEIHSQGGIGIVAHSWDVDRYWSAYHKWIPLYGSISADVWEVNYAYPEHLNQIIFELEAPYIYSHDFHDSGASWITNTYSVVMAESTSKEHIIDALVNRRVVVIKRGTVFGSDEAIELYETLKGSTG